VAFGNDGLAVGDGGSGGDPETEGGKIVEITWKNFTY